MSADSKSISEKLFLGAGVRALRGGWAKRDRRSWRHGALAAGFILVALGATAPACAVTLNTIATSGYDADIVFESGLTAGATGANNEIGSRQFFEKGATSPTDSGLPQTLPSFAAATGNTINYAFQPFEQNNILKFTSGTAAKSITLAAPATYSRLAVIHSGGSIATNTEYGLLSYKINYVGGATQTGVINAPDWGGITTLPPGTERIFATDRTTANATAWPITAEASATANRWAIYVSEITPTNTATAIQSVTFGPNSLYTIASMTTGPLNSGDDLVVFGIAGAPGVVPSLRLTVNKLSGVIQLTNPTTAAIDFNGYEITSAAGSLNLAGWSSLADRNVTPVDGPDGDSIIGNGLGEKWDEAGGASNAALMEGFLLGATSIAPGASLPLGQAFNKTVNAEDIVFKVRSNGVLSTLPVAYIQTLPADFDADGDVDNVDLTALRGNFGSTTATSATGDADGDADVDGGDFLVWQQFKGTTPPLASASGRSIPEPAGATLVILAGLSVNAVRRRRALRESTS